MKANTVKKSILASLMFLFSPVFLSAADSINVTHEVFKSCKQAVDFQDEKPSNDKFTNDVISTLTLLCTAYVMGLDDMHQLMARKLVNSIDDPEKIKKEKVFLYCKPGNITYGQMARIVATYGKERPESLALPAELFVTMAFHNSYPCTTK